MSDRPERSITLPVYREKGPEAAGELGVEEHTIYRWRKLPAFCAELDRQHRAFLAALAPRPTARGT